MTLSYYSNKITTIDMATAGERRPNGNSVKKNITQHVPRNILLSLKYRLKTMDTLEMLSFFTDAESAVRVVLFMR